MGFGFGGWVARQVPKTFEPESDWFCLEGPTSPLPTQAPKCRSQQTTPLPRRLQNPSLNKPTDMVILPTSLHRSTARPSPSARPRIPASSRAQPSMRRAYCSRLLLANAGCHAARSARQSSPLQAGVRAGAGGWGGFGWARERGDKAMEWGGQRGCGGGCVSGSTLPPPRRGDAIPRGRSRLLARPAATPLGPRCSRGRKEALGACFVGRLFVCRQHTPDAVVQELRGVGGGRFVFQFQSSLTSPGVAVLAVKQVPPLWQGTKRDEASCSQERGAVRRGCTVTAHLVHHFASRIWLRHKQEHFGTQVDLSDKVLEWNGGAGAGRWNGGAGAGRLSAHE